MKKMKDLELKFQLVRVCILLINDRYIVIDGEKNSTGVDIALLFSDEVRARLYAENYQSLQKARVVVTTIFDLVDHFEDRVEYFILNRPSV